MQLNTIKRIHKNKKRGYVGRGGKRGKTAGRGTKGQKARAGRKIRPEIRDTIKRLPKLRGRGKNLFKSIQDKVVAMNLDIIEKNYANGDVVSPETMTTKGLLLNMKGKHPKVKILGNGTFTKKVSFARCTISGSAKKKIEDAGAKIL